jgi:putative ABC transport system permease protein
MRRSLAWLLIVTLSAPSGGRAGDLTPGSPAIQSIVAAFARHRVVAIAEAHWLRQAGELALFAMFAALAVALAAAGIYGVLAGSASERTREIGVRAALGASSAEIVGMVLRQGVAMAALGAGIGLVVAVAACWVPARVDPMETLRSE